MNLDRGMYRVAKDLRADDLRRAAEDRRTLAARQGAQPMSHPAASAARRPIFSGLRVVTGLKGWLRA